MSKFVIEAHPHIRSKKNTTDKIMARVLIALTPALVMSVYIFGWRSLILSAVCVLACIGFEIAYRRLINKDKKIDLSPAVTGLLLAFCLPVTFPFYMAVIGCFVAIVVVKQMFGGLGQNFANPAITARIVLFLSFTAESTHWVKPIFYTENKGYYAVSHATGTIDGLTSATPLVIENAADMPSTFELLMGFHGGCIGEVSSVALILGFAYLVFTRVIRPIIPLTYVGTVALGALIAGADVGLQVFGGGLILGAVFMATDYATSPVSFSGKFIFGIGCGIITLVIRFFADMPEGVSFAILIMNILVHYIDKITTPRPFGYKKEKVKEFENIK